MINKIRIGISLLLTLFLSVVVTLKIQPVAVVVPHHNIVENQRSSIFSKVSKKRFSTKHIILISPDHFSPGQKELYYSDQKWNLSDGVIEYDQEIGNNLIKHASLQPHYVSSDHGIHNILKDINKCFPKAKIFPLIIGQQIESVRLEKLIDDISKECSYDCLLIASIDMSHYLPSKLAEIHDGFTIKVLNNLSIEESYNAEIDSPQSLYILMSHAKNKNALSWVLKSHTNSAVIENNKDAESTSHLMGWYQQGFKKPEISKVQTFVLATNLDPETDTDSLGKRFFYGTDYQNNSFEGVKKIGDSLNIIATHSSSLVVNKDDQTNIYLGDDVVVGGLVEAEKFKVTLFPLENNQNSKQFMKGYKKDQILESISIDDGTITNTDDDFVTMLLTYN